jgi:BlaI family transcriptional regulator, penicillinase repressor
MSVRRPDMPDMPELTPAQREIMEIIWERGELSASEVRRILSQTRPVARNTVRTLIERMEEKGWITHRPDGRTFLYSAAQQRNVRIGQKVREVIETVCGGSPEALVTALLDYRGLSPTELERIRQMLSKARATKGEKGKR